MNQLCANNQLSERSQLKITAIVELKCTVVTIPHYFQLSVFCHVNFVQSQFIRNHVLSGARSVDIVMKNAILLAKIQHNWGVIPQIPAEVPGEWGVEEAEKNS